MTETLSSREALADTLKLMAQLEAAGILPMNSENGRQHAAFQILNDLEWRHGFTCIRTSKLEELRAAHRESTETAAETDASDGDDCTCPVATLETAFRPHEALVGALDTLAELGVVTLESDIDVVAARLIAALDDVGACVAYEEDTEPDIRPRDTEDRPEPAPEVCPFLIPFIKSEPWWTAREVFDVGGMQFAVVTGQSGHTPGLTDVRGGK